MDSTSPYSTALKNFYYMNRLVLKEILSDVICLESMLGYFNGFIIKISNVTFRLHELERLISISPISMYRIGYAHSKNFFASMEEEELRDIPETVSTIEKNAFQFCAALSTVVIPASVKRIEEEAFSFLCLLSLF